MKRGYFILLLLLVVFCHEVYAQRECVTVDTSSWTQDQKNLRESITYRLAFEAGQDLIPSVEDDQICFESPIFNISSIITEKTLLDKIESERIRSVSEVAQIEQERTDRDVSIRSKLATIGFTSEEIDTLTN